ncbi:ctf8 chromosome transmission fidelity factor 8 [Anaeramoeba flamelloides]|uniref:Ctf8 chromosome transmission fidelity factor 8 n=1 Tax=Anaeramoeba flamelloides TaxID=1746091 RepID=A0AAV7YLL0_9EUKA|nr:ctf8 chromosome transmission fidelity factor 8 [Anaeramoeba flamelloides]
MLKLFIKPNPETEEWALLELQGILETQKNMLDGLKLGDFTRNGDDLVLIVGNHKLEGKVVQLSKPLYVLKKKTTPLEKKNSSTNYHTIAKITYKYLFNKRPNPYVSKQILTSQDRPPIITKK